MFPRRWARPDEFSGLRAKFVARDGVGFDARLGQYKTTPVSV